MVERLPRLVGYVLFSLPLVAVLVLHSCAHSPPVWPWEDCREEQVYLGEETREYPSVGMLYVVPIRATCTGTLITKRLVLTAAHCVDYLTGHVKRGELLWSSGDVRVYAESFVSLGKDVGQADMALVYLERDVKEIAPSPLLSDELSNAGNLVFVGYGCNRSCRKKDGSVVYEGVQVKRSVTFPAYGFEPLYYRSDLWWICPGDSGGPVLTQDGFVVAVASATLLQREGTKVYHRSMIFADVRPLAKLMGTK